LLLIPLRNHELDDAVTLQAWVKLASGQTGSLFKLDSTNSLNDVEVNYATTPNAITLTVAYDGDFKTFTISDFYPTGNVDGRGDDLFNAFTDAGLPETNFSQNFVHVSVTLKKGESPLFYLNGRRMDDDYLETLPEDASEVPTIETSGTYIFAGFPAEGVVFGEGLNGNIDEVRVWNTVLGEDHIRRDFKRYLGGMENNLIA